MSDYVDLSGKLKRRQTAKGRLVIYSGETQEVVGWEKGGETGYLYRLQSTDSGKLQLIFVKTLDNS